MDGAQKMDNDVESMELNEYLQFLIRNFFSQYSDKKIMLSIYNIEKQLIFSTKLTQEILMVNILDIIYTTPLQRDNNNPHSKYLHALDNALDFVLKSQEGCSIIVFDKLGNRFGALKVRIDPLFKHNDICGISVKAMNFTKLFFGVDKGADLVYTNSGIKIGRSEIEHLSNRQKQILFLLLLGFTQNKIAESLEITRGTVVKTIAQICQKLHFPTLSASYLLQSINKHDVLKMLSLPDMKIEPMIIFVTHDLSWVYT